MFNESEFAAIVRTHGPTVRLFITNSGIPEISADDVLQKTWCSFWDTRQNYDPARGSIVAFLCGIARRRCIDEFRATACRFTTQSHAHSVSQLPLSESEPETADVLSSLPAPEPSDSSYDTTALRSMFDRLPADQSMTLQLHFFEGYSVGEIAALQQIHHSSVTGRIQRGVAALRSLLCHA